MVNLSEISGAFRKDEIQSPEQKGCPLTILAFLALMGVAGLLGYFGAGPLIGAVFL